MQSDASGPSEIHAALKKQSPLELALTAMSRLPNFAALHDVFLPARSSPNRIHTTTS